MVTEVRTVGIGERLDPEHTVNNPVHERIRANSASTAARRAGLPSVRRRLAWIALAVMAFGFGVALGEALSDGPGGGGGTQTLVRTLSPLPLAPARETVTVTVKQP